MLSADKLKDRFYGNSQHPYRVYEKKIEEMLQPGDRLLDAGCGRGAPVLKKLIGKEADLLGVDLENPIEDLFPIKYMRGDFENLPIQTNSVDMVISRAVLEHLESPRTVFCEVRRILKPGGRFLFLVPNWADYGSVLSWLIPNRFHPWIVSRTEGRREDDVFPVYYRANTASAIRKLGGENNLKLINIWYLGQYPSYFMFSPFLFLAATGYEKIINKYDCFRSLRSWLLVLLAKEC